MHRFSNKTDLSLDISAISFALNLDNSLTIVIEKTGTSNGMGFNKNQTKFYFCDSMDCTVSEFDYDKSTGDIFNRKIIFVTDFDTMGRPDGMCVDIQDNLLNRLNLIYDDVSFFLNIIQIHWQFL